MIFQIISELKVWPQRICAKAGRNSAWVCAKNIGERASELGNFLISWSNPGMRLRSSRFHGIPFPMAPSLFLLFSKIWDLFTFAESQFFLWLSLSQAKFVGGGHPLIHHLQNLWRKSWLRDAGFPRDQNFNRNPESWSLRGDQSYVSWWKPKHVCAVSKKTQNFCFCTYFVLSNFEFGYHLKNHQNFAKSTFFCENFEFLMSRSAISEESSVPVFVDISFNPYFLLRNFQFFELKNFEFFLKIWRFA